MSLREFEIQTKINLERQIEQLREQNRVLREAAQQAMDLIHEDIVQGDKAGRRLKAEAILWNALTATRQPVKPQGRIHACDIPGCVSCGNPDDATSQEGQHEL